MVRGRAGPATGVEGSPRPLVDRAKSTRRPTRDEKIDVCTRGRKPVPGTTWRQGWPVTGASEAAEREAAEGQPGDRAKDVRASVAEVAKPCADQEWPEQALDQARLLRIVITVTSSL